MGQEDLSTLPLKMLFAIASEKRLKLPELVPNLNPQVEYLHVATQIASEFSGLQNQGTQIGDKEEGIMVISRC